MVVLTVIVVIALFVIGTLWAIYRFAPENFEKSFAPVLRKMYILNKIETEEEEEGEGEAAAACETKSEADCTSSPCEWNDTEQKCKTVAPPSQ